MEMEMEEEEDIIYINWTEFEMSFPIHSEIDDVLSRPLDGHEPIMTAIQEEDVVPVPVPVPIENEKLFLLQSMTTPLTYNTNLIFTFPIDNIPNFHFFFSS